MFSKESCWDILDTYYHKGGSQDSVNPLIKHQIDSYNKFIDNTLGQIISGFNPIKIGNNLKTENTDQTYKINISIVQPSLTKASYQLPDGTHTIMTPYIARMNNLTYSSNLYVNVNISIEVTNADGMIEKFDKTVNGVYIGKIPIMVRSKSCILYQVNGIGEENNNECRYDFGGYFIVNGNEKVLISQDRINENKTLVFQPNNNTEGLYAEIRSMKDNSYLPPKTTSLNMSGKLNHMGRIIRLNTSFLRSEIPVFVMFRALGVISDKDIIKHIVYDLENNDNKRIITELMACCEDACDVHTQEQAENILLKILSGANKNIDNRELLKNNLINDFLPHTGKNFKRKALYLGFMIRKMLRIYMGYDSYDNRDSYMNKRVDTPGILMSNLFRQCYSKMTKELKVVIEKELNLWRANNNITTADIITDVNIRRYFKQSLMESWIKYSLSTGNWGIKSIGSYQNIKQGVSQVLNRMSYSSTLSHLRRINTSMEKNGKLVQPRKLDHSQMGMICPAECFDPNTPILLWNGTIKKAEDIIIGDYLIDDNGNSVRVKSTCSGHKTMYEVIQHKNNFMNYTVTDNHILTLKVKKHKNVRNHRGKIELMWFDKKELKYKYKDFNNTEDLNEFSSSIDDDNVIDITIEQYLYLPENVQNQLYTFKSDGINWETKEVALNPYILGMWLGDGFSSGYGFATADKELLDEWIKWGVDNDATITKGNRYSYTISSTINNTQTGISCNKSEKAPLKKLLAKYNLVNNKHIPLDYLTNDRKTRLAVLAGLIDTDGSVRANGHEIRICQGEPNNKIIYDAEFLARSLGFSCHLNDGICSYTVNGEKRQKPYKELSITGKYLYEIPTILPRKKLNKCNNTTHERRCDSYLQSSFKLVQKDVQPFVGWQLEGNGRFLLGDMSISHNTPEGSSVGLVKNMALSTSISVSMDSTHIRNVLKDEGVYIYDDNNTDDNYLDKLGDSNNIYVMINGDIYGYHDKPNELYTKLKHYKRSGYIYPMTSVIWDIQHRFITISTEAGRMYRPLYIVDIDPITKKRELRINRILKRKNISWEEYKKDKNFDYFIAPCEDSKIKDEDSYLDEEGFIEYMDCEEINHAMIATFPSDLDKGMKGTAYPPFYTHCEVHPSLMNGILGVNIPFSDHNQSPRNCYQCINQNETVYMSNGTYKQIKDIVVGDKVVCFNPESMINDYTTVVAQYNRLTPKMVYTVSTISGRNIIATYDHKFITNQGWMEVQYINELIKLGIYIKNYNYRTPYISHEVNIDNMIIFKNTEEYSNIYKDMGLYPLSNTNDKINIIARIAGYYYVNKNVFTNKKDADDFNKDVEFIGFKYGVFDTNYLLYFNRLTENIEWLSNCSNITKIEFISAYLGAIYKSLDNIKKNNSSDIPEIPISYVFDNIDETISKIMEKFNVNKDWYETNDGIALYYNTFGARYNNEFLKEIAIINEYINYTKYKYRIGWDSDYTIDQWNKLIEFKGDIMFVPFYSKTKNNNHKISDITVESENHSFIAGNGFAVSNCAMGKQALGVYMSNFNRRIDTMGNILNYPQSCIVRTRLSKYTYSSELPSGTNAIVAIMTHTGFNQEDSIMVNQSALDRGLFTSTYYKAMRDVCTKNHSTGEEEVFTNPTNMTNGKPFSYRKLGDDGFVEKNTYVDATDIIAGKVMPKKTNGVINYQDNSLCMKANDEGYIDMNYSGINSDGYKFCKVRIRKNRKPEIGDKCACYTPDHQYLTTDGWIDVGELTLKHKIASMVDGKLVYQSPLELHEYDYKGAMYSVETNQVNLLVTPNHRMLYRPKYTGAKFQIKNAEELYNTRYKMKKDVDEWEPDFTDIPECLILNEEKTKITHFKFPEYTDGNNKYHDELIIDIDSWLTIYGIYIAEGSVSNTWNIQIAANKPRVQEALDKVFDKYTNIKIGKNLSRGERVAWSINNGNMARQIGKGHIAITKTLQDWVWFLNREQCQQLVYSMCIGDGCFSGNSIRYYTSSTKLADDFQRLCLHAGYSANKSLKTAQGTRNYSLEKIHKKQKEEIGQINVKISESYTTADYWMLSVIKAQNEPVINKNIVSEKHPDYKIDQYHDKWVDYEGKVYCCTMPNDAAIYVKRNGKTVWGKNSRAAQKGTIGMTYRHQDMPFTKDGIVPDIIMNPHAIPSRMTIAQLMECIMGKAGCHIGSFGDATPYNDCSVESIAKVLELSGMERYGNEIMYNGRTGEQIKTEIFIGPTYYQRLKHMVVDKIHCILADHEVLTSTGWKFIPEVTMDDEVAILKDGKLVYEKPLEVHHYPDYEGKMYRIKNSNIDLDVTANHRMYVKTCHTRKRIWSDYRLEKAEDIMGKMAKYKKNAEWEAPIYQFILPVFEEHPEKTLDMNSWLTFFGIWLAEGWAYNGKYDNKYRIGFAVNKQRVKDVLYNAVTKMGYSYNVCDEHLEINNKQLHAYLAPLSVGAPNKYMPEWVWKLSKEQAQLLVHSMQLGDGSFNKTTSSSMYYTSSIKLADDFMRLLLHAGWSGNKTCHIKAGANTVYIKEREITNNHDIWRISVIKRKNEPCVNHGHVKTQEIQEEEIYDYKGAVYCLSVSSEIFMVRRNGKPVWTGNSRGSNGPIVMLTRQASEGRARNGGLRLGEMERDAILGHALPGFLKEKMLDTADNYRIFICKKCGISATVNTEKNIYKCNNCKNSTDIAQVRIPYAFKLLTQELYTMNVMMRYVCN